MEEFFFWFDNDFQSKINKLPYEFFNHDLTMFRIQTMIDNRRMKGRKKIRLIWFEKDNGLFCRCNNHLRIIKAIL